MSPGFAHGDAFGAHAQRIAAGIALAALVTRFTSSGDRDVGLWLRFSVGHGTVAVLVSRARR